jgi:hypothetical protein
MVVELNKWNKDCPVLDEMLTFFMNTEINPPFGVDKSRFRAKKYIEHTKLTFDDILKKQGITLTTAYFDFDSRLGTDSTNNFVHSFEKFIHFVIKEINYIAGL